MVVDGQFCGILCLSVDRSFGSALGAVVFFVLFSLEFYLVGHFVRRGEGSGALIAFD